MTSFQSDIQPDNQPDSRPEIQPEIQPDPQPGIQLGIAKVEITPRTAIPLAGFAHRRDVFEAVSRPLYVRAWLFVQEDGEGIPRKALFVQGDIICWAPERLPSLARKLQESWQIEPEYMLFHASHTHGGPQTTDRLLPLTGRLQPDYADFLDAQVEHAVALAHQQVEPVRIERGTGSCAGISVNRRKQVGDSIMMAPNPSGVNDTELIVFRFVTASSQTKGVLFHFTCHPTTTADNRVTSDYCGAAMESLDATYGESVSCFLQGCCGDIRPNLCKDGEFYRGSDSDAVRNGRILADAVRDILGKPLQPVRPVAFAGRHEQVELPYERLPTLAELQPDDRDTETIAAWKRFLLDNPQNIVPNARMKLQLLQLAEGLALLAMDGEVVVEYGLLIKSRSQGSILPLGYSNGMIGYVPTARQIIEGGYESKESCPFFGLPSRFATGIEANIHAGLRKLIEFPA